MFDLAPEQMSRIAERLRQDARVAKESPLEKTVVIAGDWNPTAEGETGFAFADAPDNFEKTATVPTQ